MKKIEKYLRSNRGSVSTVVITTTLFFIVILSTAFMVTSTLRKSQLRSQAIVKETYEKDFNNIDEIKNSLMRCRRKIWV